MRKGERGRERKKRGEGVGAQAKGGWLVRTYKPLKVHRAQAGEEVLIIIIIIATFV